MPPYKKYVFLTFLFNILSTVFSLFSFAAVIPVLRLLFKLDNSNAVYQNWEFSDSFNHIVGALKNNLEYSIEQTIQSVGPSTTLMYLGLFLIVMTGFKVGTAFLASFYMIPIRTGVVRDIRNGLYNKILSLPLGFFSEERKGDIISRMTGDVGELEASVMSSLDMIFKNPLMIVIYLAVMFVMSWELTLFVLLLLPFSGWMIGRIGRSLRQSSKDAQELTGD